MRPEPDHQLNPGDCKARWDVCLGLLIKGKLLDPIRLSQLQLGIAGLLPIVEKTSMVYGLQLQK